MAKHVLKPKYGNKEGYIFMKGLIVRRLVLSIFATLMLAFSVQSITDVQVPDTLAPQTLKKSSRKNNTVPIAARFDIAISEIMYATNADNPPQWIELHNRSTQKVSLEGWEVTIENHPEDRSVLATMLTFTLSAKILNVDEVLLLVTEQGHNSAGGDAKDALRANRIVILKDLIGGTPGYRLLSQTAFKVTLTAPAAAKTARKIPSDMAGNLGAIPEWELPLIEGKRSSIIREYVGNDATKAPYDGTTEDNWKLAAEKDSQDIRHITWYATYYGHRSDHGTPGYRVPAPLPVALSKFRPEVEKRSGTIIIRWITESEMNNAGFNIKRSETRDGEFKIINPAMIPGAGTTSERQSYTYTDKTAKPKVVYYYQLECISVDGTRQTLRTTRLRGNINIGQIPWLVL